MKANWNYPTNILVGAGRTIELASLCKEQCITKPLIVTDPFLASLGMISDVTDNLSEAGMQVGVFSAIKPNPTGTNIRDGIKFLSEGNHDAVIAIGGGSALDAGKTIALMAHQSCDLFDIEDIGNNWENVDVSLTLPIIALPTTAGTGSEVGRAAVIVNEQESRKVILFHPQLLPKTVVLDPLLTIGLPATLTAATGMDALSHNLEALCAPTYHPMAEGIAMQGIHLIRNSLQQAVEDGGDIEARTQMLVASTMGATAFQKGLGAMHALAHPLGAIYDAHHGMLNAILMPYILKANQRKIDKTVSQLATYLGIKGGFNGFLDWILELRTTIQIPHQLTAIIPDNNQFERVAKMAVDDPSAATNPITFTVQEYLELLHTAYNGH